MAADVLYLRPGTLSTTHKVCGVILALLATYTHVSLRAEYLYYRTMAKSGCAPIKAYPNNPAGIPFLLETAKGLQTFKYLELRVQQLATLGHTFQHRVFPETCMNIMVCSISSSLFCPYKMHSRCTHTFHLGKSFSEHGYTDL
jgi:hypothetical protein